tara:strand:- start:957 stop:1250 length:294 start_codon:yes stop_codon:yes gene_type:complete
VSKQELQQISAVQQYQGELCKIYELQASWGELLDILKSKPKQPEVLAMERQESTRLEVQRPKVVQKPRLPTKFCLIADSSACCPLTEVCQLGFLLVV